MTEIKTARRGAGQARTRRRTSRRAKVSRATIALYASLTVAGIMLFRAGAAVAYAERGYNAVGGEVFALFLPAFYYIISQAVGDIVADMAKNTIQINRFGEEPELIDVNKLTDDFAGHGGGDSRMVEEFLDHLITGEAPTIRTTSLERSIESHFAALAAEKSRKEGGRVVELSEIRG